jgi:glycosyltransferase involved in cell wall biosynthesis
MTRHGIIEPDLRHRVLNLLDRACLRRADALVAVSSLGAQQLRHITVARPIHLVRNGVRAPVQVSVAITRHVREQLGAGDHHHLVGYIGRLSREKRPDLFLDVAAQIAARRSTARFVLIGGGALADEVRSKAARSTAAAHIVLAGLRHDMDAVYTALDLLIIPSDVENTPRVLHEALSRGVPVVVTAVGDMPLMTRGANYAETSPPGDPDALAAAAIELLAANPALDQRPIEPCPSEGSVNHMARSVQQVYSTLLPPVGAGRGTANS